MSMQPRYLISHVGRDGRQRFYWQPSSELRRAGWRNRRLSDDPPIAFRQAEEINRKLDAERGARGDGGLYVISKIGGSVKIGIGRVIEDRLKTLQTAADSDLRVCFYASLPTRKARHLEATLHALFIDRRRIGEWFDVPIEEAVLAAARGVLDITNEGNLT